MGLVQRIALGFAFVLSATAATIGQEAIGKDSGSAWRRSALFDDGQAEFAAYEIQWPRYGSLRRGRALMVVVKEPWAPDLAVKADVPRKDGFDVLKLNHIRTVQTGIYAYHQMASSFLRREDLALEKLEATSFEACGLSSASIGKGVLVTRSYFDGEGVREQPWQKDAIAEDTLPLRLRDYVSGPLPARLLVVRTLMTGRFGTLNPRAYRLLREHLGTKTYGGVEYQSVELRLEHDSEVLRFEFSARAPHVMLRHEKPDGTRYLLAKVERLAYWNRLAEDDEQWWPEELRTGR